MAEAAAGEATVAADDAAAAVGVALTPDLTVRAGVFIDAAVRSFPARISTVTV